MVQINPNDTINSHDTLLVRKYYNASDLAYLSSFHPLLSCRWEYEVLILHLSKQWDVALRRDLIGPNH